MTAGSPNTPDDGTSQWYIHWLLWRIFKPEYAVELSFRVNREKAQNAKLAVSHIQKAAQNLLSQYR